MASDDVPAGVTCTKSTVTQDNVLLTLAYEGYGLRGEYDPADPTDYPVLVISVYWRSSDTASWVMCRDSRWMTYLPATISEAEQHRALTYLLHRLYYAATIDSCKGLLKELANIERSWYMPHLQRAADERQAELDLVAQAAARSESPYAPSDTASKYEVEVELDPASYGGYIDQARD